MKTILITGSTDGIGKLAAMKLAKKGHSIYIHGRNKEKLDASVSEIQSNTGNKHVKGFLADFSNLDSVKGMAKKIKKETKQIDVLINNAGVYSSPVAENKDGFDLRFVVNYFAPYLLTETLMPLLEKGSRLINLSSAAQETISYDLLLGNSKGSEGQTYAQSKLALTMWSFYLAKQFTDIVVIAVNPGSLLNTKMVKEAFGRHWSPADKGANILYELATSKKYEKASGIYFDNDKGDIGKAHPDAYDGSKIDKLIKTTQDLIY